MKGKLLLVTAMLLFLSGTGLGATHPGSQSDCAQCHRAGQGVAGVPKVLVEPPGFFAQLFGKKERPRGHASVSCAGAVLADGTLTGCHRPEAGHANLLVVQTRGRPSDEFCGRCHAPERQPGEHHPSYRVDKDGDGTTETVVRTPRAQELYTQFAASAKPEPLRSSPDAILFQTRPDGTRYREVVLPVETVVEMVEGKPVTEADVVTCTTCHNPHYGYLIEVGSEEELNRELVARAKGDALLRLRDHDNALCEACH